MIDSGRGNAQIGLVAFHSFFNFLGVLLILPLTRLFARLIRRLVPEEGAPLADRLDDRLLSDLDAASDATSLRSRYYKRQFQSSKNTTYRRASNPSATGRNWPA